MLGTLHTCRQAAQKKCTRPVGSRVKTENVSAEAHVGHAGPGVPGFGGSVFGRSVSMYEKPLTRLLVECRLEWLQRGSRGVYFGEDFHGKVAARRGVVLRFHQLIRQR